MQFFRHCPCRRRPWVPGNCIGLTRYGAGQLKNMRKVSTRCVFVPVAVVYLVEPLKLDFL